MNKRGLFIGAWRTARQQAPEQIAEKIGVSTKALEEIEANDHDVTVSTVEALAQALDLPAPWLYVNPAEFETLFRDTDDEGTGVPFSQLQHPDPVLERVIAGARKDRTLFTLLTALLESGDAKLLRAAEMSLRSLLKQSRHAALPWQARTPGNFEPPSD